MVIVVHNLCQVTWISLVASMVLVTMCGVAIQALHTVDPRQVDGKSVFNSLKATKCSVECRSTKMKAVCGTNGRTYPSRCDLKRAKKCDKLRIKMDHWGKCTSEPETEKTNCDVARIRAIKSHKNNPMVVVPSCKSDGSYKEIQCHSGMGYCWCVTGEGRHVPGTSVKISAKKRRPRCRGKRAPSKGSKRSSRRKKKCTSEDRQTFNAALIKVFKEEYLRVYSSPPPPSGENADEYDTEKTIVLWKFSELDRNQDGILKFKDIRNFGRMVRKLIKPRACAKRFARHCDKNKDRKIMRAEWTLCLGVDIKPGQEVRANDSVTTAPPVRNDHTPKGYLQSQGFPGLSISDPSQGPGGPDTHGRRNVSMTCFDELRAANASHKDAPDAKHYIPACAPNGLWEKAQCHTEKGYCWCVEEKTGTPIPGTATYKITPNCSFENDREMKGCPLNKKRKFLVDLMGDLTEEREVALRALNNQSNVGPEDNLTLRETVARWKLKTLDANKNGVLERKEWRPIRRTTLKNRKYARKCRRNFVRYCDEDDNKRITLEEWNACLGLNGLVGLSPENNFNSLPLNPKRTGKNPFAHRRITLDYFSIIPSQEDTFEEINNKQAVA